MRKIIKNAAIIATAVAASLSFSSAAYAGGFLADTFIRPFSPEAADAADRANEALGRPVERAGAAGMDYFVPGSGRVAEEIWERNRTGGWGGRSSGGFQDPGFAQQPMGSFCYTQAGRFGPGPVNPLGAPCTANTQWGMMPGQVGQ